MSEFGRVRSLRFAPFKGRRMSFVRQPARFRRPRRRRRRRRPANRRTGGFLGQELKFYDKFLAAKALVTNTDSSGGEADPSATVLLNTVVQGDGESNRDGRQMVMKSIFVSGVITCVAQINQTAIDEGTDIAIWLVLDKQTNGATINSEDVFTNPVATSLGGTSLFRNLENTKRFQILDKWRMTLTNPPLAYDGTNIEQGGLIQPFVLSANLKNMVVNFSGTTETVANIRDNSLHVIAFCTNAGLVPLISYNSRLRFVG